MAGGKFRKIGGIQTTAHFQWEPLFRRTHNICDRKKHSDCYISQAQHKSILLCDEHFQ